LALKRNGQPKRISLNLSRLTFAVEKEMEALAKSVYFMAVAQPAPRPMERLDQVSPFLQQTVPSAFQGVQIKG
jgi:hypothetical protein